MIQQKAICSKTIVDMFIYYLKILTFHNSVQLLSMIMCIVDGSEMKINVKHVISEKVN